MTSPVRKTFRHASVYAVGDMIRHFVGFIMLPIYTRHLSPADYGVVELLAFTLAVVGIFVGMRMGQAVLRYYYEAEAQEAKNSVITTALVITAAGGSVGSIALMLASADVAQWVFGDPQYSTALALFAVLLLTQGLEEWALVYLRATQRPVLFVTLNVLKLLIQLGANLVFVVALELHVMGVVYSALLASSALAVVGAVYVLGRTGFAFSRDFARRLLVFSYPLWLAALPTLFTSSADRYFLRIFGGLDEVGLYGLAYKFGMLVLILVWGPFEKIWSAQRFEIAKQADAPEVFSRVFLYLNAVLALVALGIGLFAEEVIHVMAAPAYYSAYEVVPILVLANVIPALIFFNNFGFMWAKRTGEIAVGTYVTMLAAAVGYLTLIPSFGMYGAAWATVFAYVVQLGWVLWRSRRYYDLRLPWERTLALWVWGGAIFFASLGAPAGLWSSLGTKAALVLLFLGGLSVLPILEAGDRCELRMLVGHPRRVFRLVGKGG